MKSLVVCLLIAVVASGCGGSSGPPVAVFPVSGVITLSGKPVVGADVTFSNSEMKRSAFGRTNEKGEYRLTTFSANDGAVEGKSIVTVLKAAPAAAVVVEADIESEAYVPPDVNAKPVKTNNKQQEALLPERYSNATTSGLIAVIATDMENKHNFELEP